MDYWLLKWSLDLTLWQMLAERDLRGGKPWRMP